MTKDERESRIAALRERKKAATWRYIGACNEINDQIKLLEATPTEGEDNEPGTKD